MPLAATALGAYGAGTDPSWATPEAQNKRDLERARAAARSPLGFGPMTDGYDERGNPIGYQGPPSGVRNNQAPITMRGDVHLDGRKVGEILSEEQARRLRLPNSGRIGFDGTMSPSYSAGGNP